MFNFRHLCTQTLPRLSVALSAFFFLLAADCPTRAQSSTAPRAFITEFAASNSTFLDEDGDPSDWLELHNPAASPLVLTGWFLSDDPAQPRKWRFPETVLPAGDFLVIWASGKDRRTAGSPLHTNFSLSGTGESLILSRQDGSVSHQFLNYPALGTMVSCGMQFESARWTPDPLRGVYRVPLGPTPRWFESDFPAGGWSSFTGHQGFGPAAVQPGMRLRQVGAAPGFGEVNTLARCDALLALPGDSPLISVQATERVSSVNYGGSHYPGDTLLPTPATDFYAVQATGMVLIPTAGTYSFGLNSDDGGRIRIDGQDVMVDDSLHGEQDHIGTVTLSAGYHAFEMVMFENGGGDLVEFYAAPGVHTEWSAAMKLVGDTANGGLATFLASPSNGLTEAEMRGIQASCYFRVGLQPTSPPALQALSTLRLHVRYDDGFAAFMNGTRVASRNAPASLTHASTATAMHPLMASDPFESHNLTPFLPLVRFSGNVLALQGLNVSAGDASFFLDAEVVAGRLLVDAPPVAFENGQRTPGTVNSPQTAVLGSAPVLLSVPAGYYTQPFTLTLQSPTPGSTIRYTLDGSTPTATSGAVYSRPLTVAKTSVLRSAAFRAGSAASAVTTATYFFMDDVLTQSPTGAKPSPAWPAVNNGQHFIHYGMSPLIVNSTDPEIGGRAKVREGLLSLPAVSLVTDLPNFFDSETGILFNPNGRGSQWERPCSMEFLSPPGTNRPNGSQEFQIDCGARTRGGFSRDPSNPKHGFHLYFRGRYGAPKLEYPLFGESGAQTFDQIDLRTAQNYSWSFGGDLNNSFLREESSRRAQLEMGQPASHVRYFHLFINGHYWGLFNFDERKEASFGATYFGGSKEEYDVIKCEQSEGHVTGITDGQIDAWRDLWEKGRAHAATPSNAAYFSLMGLQADGTTPSTDPVLLDVDNLIDYLLLTFWTGNEDGCTSAFLGNGTANNWFGLRNRNSTAGFRFFAHDFEHSLGLPSGSAGVDRTGPFESENRALFERSNPYFLHLDLLPNPEYRIRWADRIQKHLFGNGALSTAAWTRRIQTLAAEIDSAITAESARWGGSKTETPLNRRHWLDSKNWILNTFIPARHDIVLAQLRKPELGLFPQTDAPQLSPSGGRVAPGTPLTVLSTSTVYRMPDGSDPRAIGGGIRPGAIASPPSTGSTQTPVSFGSQWRYLDTGVDQGSAWRTAGFDDSAWALGNGELGYGDGDETTAIQGGPADARHATAYFRRTFSLTGVSGIVSATLSLKYDDEAWVYLNGQLVHKTAVGLPDNPRFDAYTGTGNENTAATFTLDPALFLEGSNLLAVEVHQGNATSSDLSFDLQLQTGTASEGIPILASATPGIQTLRLRALNDSTNEWSALTETTLIVGLESPAPGSLAIAELLYAPAPPTEAEKNAGFRNASDFEFVLLQNVSASHLDLAGVRLDKAVEFTVTEQSPHRILAPGGLLIVAANPAAFVARSGSAIPVTGPFKGNLANEGDHLRVLFGSSLITQLSYTAGGLWPRIPDGSGHSLVRAQPTSQPGSGSTPGEWFVSYRRGGDFQQTPPPQGSIQLGTASLETVEAPGTVQVPVFRTGPLNTPASVQFTTQPGSAIAGSDFAATSGTLLFPVGSASSSVNVTISGDTLHEATESFTVELANPTGAIAGAPLSTVVRILDEDSTAAPANDRFAQAQPISGSSGTVAGSNLSATRETGEPLHGGTGSTSIWFRWTAPANGTVQFRTAGSANPDGSPMDTLLAAYTGTRLNALVPIASNHDAAPGDPTSSLQFAARKGDSYLIAVDGAFGAAGTVLLDWNSPNAKFEFRSPTFSAREGSPGASVEVVRSGNTSSAASVSVSTASDSAAAGSDFTTTSVLLEFLPGQRSIQVEIPLLDDTEQEGPESFLVSLQNPSAGHSLGLISNAAVQISDDEDAPAQDHFALASTLSGESGSVTVSNAGATLESGEPVHGPDGGRSVWFVWTAPRNGRATFETMGSLTPGGMPLDTLLAVYTGTALDALEVVNRNDNAPLTPTSRVQFTAKSGQTYRIAIDDRAGGGTVLLTWSLVDSDTLLESIPGLPAPFLEVTESYSESLAGSIASGFTVQPSQKLVATLKAPMGSLTPAFLTPDAPFEIRLGDVQFSGTLGMDPVFSASKTSARIPLLHSDNQRAGTLQLSWTKTQLTLVLTVEHPELLFEAGDHFGPTGPFSGQVGASQVRFSIANFVASRRLYFSGNTTRTQLTRGTSNFTLHAVSLRASPDLSGPSIVLQRPLPPARTTAATVSIAGTISDARGVTDVQLLLNGSAFPTLTLAPALPANSVSFTAANCPLQPGKNTLELRATDRDSNVSVSKREITRSVLTPVTVTSQGAGRITGKPSGTLLEIQSSASWTASPEAGWLFERWSGSVDSTSPTLTAVITENFLLQANFVPNPFPADSGSYSGLIRSTTSAPAGSMSVTLNSLGALTGKLILSSGTFQFKGSVRSDGLFTVSIPRKGLPPLSLRLQFALRGSGQVSGTVSDTLTVLRIDAEQDATFATPPESAGAYSVLFQPGVPAFPGHGFAAGTVSSKGRMTLAGSLPDGTKFSAGGQLSRDFLFTFLTGLSKPAGQLTGFLSLQSPSMGGDWTWSRAAVGSVSGFTVSAETTVRRYQPPAANTRLLDALNAANGAAVLAFSSTALGTHSRTFVLDVKNKAAFSAVSPARAVSLSFSTASGVFTGSFQDPVSGANHSFSGIVDQGAGSGAGFFLGPKGPGTLTLAPDAD